MLMAGRRGDAGYWFDTTSGQMVTSDYYLRAYPAWVSAFNATDPTRAFFGKDWLTHKFSTRPSRMRRFATRSDSRPIRTRSSSTSRPGWSTAPPSGRMRSRISWA